jgi:uncharacterized protein (UPF0335 family)
MSTDIDNTTEDPEGKYKASKSELKAFVSRLERLGAEQKELADQVKEVKQEIKGRGYDVKTVSKIVALRKRDAEEVAEEEAMLDFYKEVLDM